MCRLYSCNDRGYVLRIVGLIILIFFCIILNLFGDNYHPFTLKEVEKKEAKIVSSLHPKNVEFFLVKNEFLKNGFTVSWYNLLEKKVVKSLYINNLYSFNERFYDNIYIISSDGKNIFLITLDWQLNFVKQVKINDNNQLKPDHNNEYEILDKVDDNLLIRLNNKIIKYNLTSQQIDNELNLFDNDEIEKINGDIFLVRASNTKAIIYSITDDLQLNYISDVTIYDDFIIQYEKPYLYFITSTENSNESLIQSINQNNKKVESIQWVKSKLNNIKFFTWFNNQYLINIENENLHNRLNLHLIKQGKIEKLIRTYEIDWNFFSINRLKWFGNEIVLVFKNGVIQLDLEFNEISKDQFDTDMEIKWIDKVENLLILGNTQNTSLIYYKENNWRYVNLFWNFLTKYGFIIILLFIIIYLTLTFRHKYRFYNEILRHPAIGCIYYLDSKGRLILANNEGQVSLKLNNNIPLKRNFHYYAKNELNIKVSEYIKKTYDNQKNLKEKIIISENGISKDWLINTFIIRNIAGMIRGVVVSVTDITEQLERQRLTNLASFVHDMQTNLSTIRLNAEQIECRDEFAQSKKKKILFQTNILTQRVRDLLAVGRDDVLDLEEVMVDEIINKVYSEFDNELYPDISFQSSGNNSKVICDKNKIIRGIRNAVENSIKYLPEKKGVISINFSQTSEKQFYCFSVEDTGIGMDSDLKNKVLTPYFTTAKKTGGSGIGSIIMQKVAELHNGRIEIESELNIGTKVKFYLPINYLKSLKNNTNKNDK